MDFTRLLQFGDSLLPVGAFSFSNGVESAAQTRVVHDLATLAGLVSAATRQAAGSDGVALLVAHRAARDGDLATIVDADHASYCRRLGEEMRVMTIRMGRKLAEMVQRIAETEVGTAWLDTIRAGETPGTYPVAQAIAFQAIGLGEREAFAAHQYGVAGMMLGASLRLLKIHYLDVQGVLFDVNKAVDGDYERVARRSLDEMEGFAPTLDILAALHVKSKIRLFMN